MIRLYCDCMTPHGFQHAVFKIFWRRQWAANEYCRLSRRLAISVNYTLNYIKMQKLYYFFLIILMASCTMRQLIEAQETSNVPVNKDKTSDEPPNNETWHGKTTNGATMPP